MDPPNGLIYQSELPFERDAVQCQDGKWVLVQLRRSSLKVLAEAGTKKEILELARTMAEMPLWEEHYVGLSLINCVPPKGVYRHPQTCFLVTDGSPVPARTRAEPESHVRLKTIQAEPAPETPRSAGWPEEQRPADWKERVKKIIEKKVRGL
jgi:hypothetical protein